MNFLKSPRKPEKQVIKGCNNMVVFLDKPAFPGTGPKVSVYLLFVCLFFKALLRGQGRQHLRVSCLEKRDVRIHESSLNDLCEHRGRSTEILWLILKCLRKKIACYFLDTCR